MTAVTPKLPIWRTARETYALIFGNLGFLLRTGLPWLLLAVALLVGLDWVKLQVGGWVGTNEFPWRELLASLAQSVLQAACLAPFAVYWHRHVLHTADERSVPALRPILAYGLAAFLIEAAFNGLVFLPAQLWPTDEAANLGLTAILVVTMGVLLLVGIYLSGRIMLILPAIALGRDRSLDAAWTASRGNGWRLFWSSLVAFLIPICVWLGVYAARFAVQLFGKHDGAEPEVTTTPPPAAASAWDLFDAIETNLFAVLIALVAISFLSVAYRELVLKRDHASAASNTSTS